jgi:hypothetical protein
LPPYKPQKFSQLALPPKQSQAKVTLVSETTIERLNTRVLERRVRWEGKKHQTKENHVTARTMGPSRFSLATSTIPIWCRRQHTWLSPMKPGFDSRYRNLFFCSFLSLLSLSLPFLRFLFFLLLLLLTRHFRSLTWMKHSCIVVWIQFPIQISLSKFLSMECRMKFMCGSDLSLSTSWRRFLSTLKSLYSQPPKRYASDR